MGPTWILVKVTVEGTVVIEYEDEDAAFAAYGRCSLATDPTLVSAYLAPVRSMMRRG